MSRSLALEQLPEVFISDKSIAALVYRETGKGRLRQLASRLYTHNSTDSAESIIRRNVWQLVAAYFPNALIADRTALEHKPATDGSVFVVSNRKRTVRLPGLTILPRKGIGQLESDRPFIGGLFLSSQARAFLENMRSSRARSLEVRRTLTQSEIEEKLDALLRHSGEEALRRLRDEVRVLAPKLNLQHEAKVLDALIGTMLGTKSTKIVSNVGQMRVAGLPYDPSRISLFKMLFEALSSTALVIRLGKASTVNLAFFEAYFSNFIEGTEFTVIEAEEIIFAGKIPTSRPEDAHDVLGTYNIVVDMQEMHKTPGSFDEFLNIMKLRHATIMGSREETTPGQFKQKPNRAGSTIFVAPDLVNGTLSKGYEFYQALSTAFAKAVFMMFLVAEVHPFTDGNGRVARVMMNAELVAKDEQRIIIPTVYRSNYLAALKALSLGNNPDPLVRTLDFAQKYTHAIDWRDLKICRNMLEMTNAFKDPLTADVEGVRLKLPN